MKDSVAKPKVTTAKKPPLVAVVLGIAVVAGLVWAGVTMFTKSNANYAEEVAKPLEKVLVETGAVKRCATGDAGRGADNRQPWYGAYYELPSSRTTAEAAILKIARDNDYSLKHATPTNRGPLDYVTDIDIDNWYFDDTIKTSPYKSLESGAVQLAFVLRNEKLELSHLSCQTAEPVVINGDENHTVIKVEVKLPLFKR